MRALVIDDSRTVRLIIGDILRELGHRGARGEEWPGSTGAVEATSRFELVLVDWNMPEMNGLDFIKAVRSDEPMTQSGS